MAEHLALVSKGNEVLIAYAFENSQTQYTCGPGLDMEGLFYPATLTTVKNASANCCRSR